MNRTSKLFIAATLLAGGYGLASLMGSPRAPYLPQQVLGMVYRHLGIDPGLTFPDFTGRPRHVLEEREPITELG